MTDARRRGRATDEQPSIDLACLRRWHDAELVLEGVAKTFVRRDGIGSAAGFDQCDEAGSVHVLVEWSLRRQRLEQHDGVGRVASLQPRRRTTGPRP